MQRQTKKTMKRKPRKNQLAQGARDLASLMVDPRALSLAVPFPRSLRRILRYADLVVINSAVGAVAVYQFRAGSLFDPDVTGGGHQPRGFDTLCTTTGPYLSYRVLGFKALVSAQISAFSTATSACIGVGIMTNTTVPTTAAAIVSQLAECPGFKVSLLTPLDGQTDFEIAATTAEIVGATPAQVLAEDNFSALSSASPVSCGILHLAVQGLQSATCDVNVKVVLEYDVLFEDAFTTPFS